MAVISAGLRLAGASILACCMLPAAAASAEQEAAGLFGLEYVAPMEGKTLVEGLSCTEEGTHSLRIDGREHEQWAVGSAVCQERQVRMLKRRTGETEDGKPRWRVEDVLLLPPLDTEQGGRGNGLSLADDGQCRVGGSGDTSLLVLVRWGKRTRVDGRAGISQVWMYDLDRGRMVQLPAARVSCTRAGT